MKFNQRLMRQKSYLTSVFSSALPNQQHATSNATSVPLSSPQASKDNDNDEDAIDIEGDFVRSRVELEKENKKLQLMMESVIPKHLVSKMRDDMMTPTGYNSNFQKYYLEYYESVSILFADIVGFTKISSQCTDAKELVMTLNELFGRFDQAAEANKCLRIKILGDCYYCVSGVPANKDKPEPHAKQCVEMGLDMIDILADLALEPRATLDADSKDDRRLKMRIGIHTGQVLCGIMGKKKWQFDVHSNDVRLANLMEQSGVPGRVHITEATLKQLGTEYQVEPANGRERDAYIAQVDIETYFVTTPSDRRKDSSALTAASSYSARASRFAAAATAHASSVGGAAEPASRASSLAATDAISASSTATSQPVRPPPRETLASATKSQQVAKASVVDQAGKTSVLGPGVDVRLTITEAGDSGEASRGQSSGVANATTATATTTRSSDNSDPLGQQHRRQQANQVGARSNLVHSVEGGLGGGHSHELPDKHDTIVTIDQNNETVSLLANSNHFHGSNGFKSLPRVSISNAETSSSNDNNDKANTQDSGRGGCAGQQQHLAIVRPVKSMSQQSIQMGSLSASLTGHDLSHSISGTSSSTLAGKQRFKRTTRAIMNASHFIRTIDPPFANLDSEPSVNIDKIICDTKAGRGQINDVHKWTLRFKDPELSRLYQERRARQNHCALFRHNKHETILLLLAFVLTLTALAYVTISQPSHSGGDEAPSIPVNLYRLISLVLLTLTSLALATTIVYRFYQIELNSRIDFVLRQKAIKDKARLIQMRECNRSIFFNILPRHVAEYFLEMRHQAHKELYSKSYEMVGVSFATVTNFNENFYEEGEANDHGKGCLNLLNEILCDFDDLLDLEQFKTIDKIKTIGTTYMTAIGLCPKRESSPTNNSASSPSEIAQQLRIMLEFIMGMRSCLEDISNNSFNTYKLRAGVNLGPVTAGVIGASKPQYDIWGNTVNVASRMESTCEPNKIQVTEDVYILLKRFFDDIKFTCRGSIDVKGKGKMTTYYVDMPPK